MAAFDLLKLSFLLNLLSSTNLSLSPEINGGGVSVFPPTCNRIECPSYDAIHTGNGFEIRRYNSSMWASTKPIDDISFVSATMKGFLQETVVKYSEAVQELAMELGRMLCRSMGLDMDLFEGWPSQFRINKYNFTPESVGSPGVQLHTDSGFLTILQDDESIGGLEVFNEKSGEFVAVDPLPGSVLVNFGDVAKVWSNGRFCNVRHRVQCKEAAVRISIALFVLGAKEAAIEAPPELVDAEHPRLFVPFTF